MVSIIYIGDVWDNFWRRRQQIAFRLADLSWVGNVIYVELPITLSSFPRLLMNKADYSASKQWRQVFNFGFIRKYSEKLLVLTPVIPISHFRFRGYFANWLCSFNEMSQVALIRKMLSRCQYSKRILWIGRPILASGFIGRFGEDCLCYDATEDFRLLKHHRFSERIEKTIAAEDQKLVKKADVIFANSSVLLESYRNINSNVHLLLNAVDMAHFNPVKLRPKPRDLLDVPPPLLGYIGTLNTTTDLALLEYLTVSCPEWSFVLLAANALEDPKAKESFQRIVQYPNVFYLGEKSYHELPAYIQHFDVGLRLYKVNELTRSQTSLTTIYFLASGKRVVTTNTAGADYFREGVFIARSKEEYVSLIGQALPEDRNKRIDVALAVARRHSWEDGLKKVEKSILEVLEKRSSYI